MARLCHCMSPGPQDGAALRESVLVQQMKLH